MCSESRNAMESYKYTNVRNSLKKKTVLWRARFYFHRFVNSVNSLIEIYVIVLYLSFFFYKFKSFHFLFITHVVVVFFFWFLVNLCSFFLILFFFVLKYNKNSFFLFQHKNTHNWHRLQFWSRNKLLLVFSVNGKTIPYQMINFISKCNWRAIQCICFSCSYVMKNIMFHGPILTHVGIKPL